MTNLSDYPKQTFVITFDIEAISIPIVYNKYGDHDPNGMLYVLKKDSDRIQHKAREYFEMEPPQPYKEVQPLVIRANEGDEIHINFYNRLGRRVSMHVQGLRYDVLTSDGANIGNNPDTTTYDFIQYVWYAEKEGVYLFSDLGDARSSEEGTNVHGLFGAIIVEKSQSDGLTQLQVKKLKADCLRIFTILLTRLSVNMRFSSTMSLKSKTRTVSNLLTLTRDFPTEQQQ